VQKAAELGDTPEIAYDLTAVINLSPPGIQSSSRIKGAVDASHLLASKYNMPPEIWKRGLLPVPLREHRGDEPGEGAISSGTGFVISPDGLILTNRHVVKGGKTFQVILQGGTKVPAEVVVIDDEQDMALIRIKVAKPMATVQLAEHDSPSDGAECTVIGFPLGNRYTASPKVTHGIVTSSKIATEGADVMIDAKVNPGNSGGPILDKSGNVMAIVAMKSLSSQMEDSYGIGISAGKIRQFLEKNKVKSTKAKSDAAGLSVEDIAAKIEPVTVLILTVH
jgi:S1-C subfamily serine protease